MRVQSPESRVKDRDASYVTYCYLDNSQQPQKGLSSTKYYHWNVACVRACCLIPFQNEPINKSMAKARGIQNPRDTGLEAAQVSKPWVFPVTFGGAVEVGSRQTR